MRSRNSFARKETVGRPHGLWVISFLVLAVTSLAYAQDSTEAGMQILTRGPIHEAFAEASMTGAAAGIVISKAAPDPIVELPPDQRPEGANVAWIPGYWSWDEDRTDFIWVSGVWRDIPPGRQWVPGYWGPAGNGSQWVSGFWGDVAQKELTYLPAPPRPLEVGPSSPMPGPNQLWTPGNWVWQQTRYDWQPGYWLVQQPDWVWTPAHYIWTPKGCVYVAGYWDRDIVHRGVMFAPVYYQQPVYSRPDYSYSPIIVIDLRIIVASLFVQPRSNHYYYGDYYDARYEKRGIYPWHSTRVARYGNDPIYAHYRSTQLAQDPDWDAHANEQFRYRRDHVDARPPQTLALQVNLINLHKGRVPEYIFVGKNLAEAAQSDTQPQRFTPVNMDERKQGETRGREVHSLQSQRARMETPQPTPGRSKRTRVNPQPVSVPMPASPVAARPTEHIEGAKMPPPMPVAPQPRAVEGRSRKAGPREVNPNTETRVPRKGQGPVKPAVQTAPSRTKEEAQRTDPHRRTRKGEPGSSKEDHGRKGNY